MKRHRPILRVTLALLLVGSVLLCIQFTEFLTNGGQQLLYVARDLDLTVAWSRMRRLHWTADLNGDYSDYRIDLIWGALARSWKDTPELGSDGLMDHGDNSVRWVSERFSLVVSQGGQLDATRSPRVFIGELRAGQRTATTYSERFRAYVSSVNYIELPLEQVLRALQSREGERWETIFFGCLDAIMQRVKQGLISWQIPVIAVIPDRAVPILAYVWVAVLAVASVGLLAPQQSAKVLRLLRKRQ